MKVIGRPVELVLPPSQTPRSPGIHLSGITRCIATESGILKPEWAEELSLVDIRLITDPIAITRICMGLAWEEWYIRTQLPEVVDHPGEMLLDGVYMTHDGEELITLILDARLRRRLKLHEIKLTFKSMRTVGGAQWKDWENVEFDSEQDAGGPLASQWMYTAQTKGYCKGAGTNLVDLHVLFACGDYTYPIRPVPYKYEIEYTQDEIDDNWHLHMEYRDTFLSREAL